ncbi:competence protein CoiA family protein [Yoonia tamlensis]|nr:competence protein CoiA family protein [Yoonia tamlensis]
MRASDRRLVHVNDVPKGLECRCVCPECEAPLIARQGERRTWHFAHKPDEDCGTAGETALHIAAKQTLADLNGRIFIPAETIRKEGWPIPNGHSSKAMAKLDDLMNYVIPKRRASKSKVRIEPRDWTDQGFQPDAVMERDDQALLIEIRVTHGVDTEKRRRMWKVGLGTIEIDLSKTDRNTSPDDLKKLLVSEAPREWLITGRPETWVKQEAQFKKRLESEASRLNRMVPRDLTTRFYVNACPRRNEPDFASVDVYPCLDCDFSGGHLGNLQETPIWNMLSEKIRRADESAMLCAHKGDPNDLPTERQKDFVRLLAGSDLGRKGGLLACLPNRWEKDKAFTIAFISAHPNCTKCHKKMVLRRNSKEQLFWGCSGHPSCTETSRYCPHPPLNKIIASHEQERSKQSEEIEQHAEERAALARPESGPNSLSNLATPFPRHPPKG